MSDIGRILRSGRLAIDTTVAAVTPEDLQRACATLAFDLPASYREFVALGGLAELRINHHVLSPSEIVQALAQVDLEPVVPFADNGCGDLYCWKRDGGAPEPAVVFAKHEGGGYIADAESFTDWLRGNRF